MTMIAETNGHSNGTHPYDATAIFPELAPRPSEATHCVNLKFAIPGYSQFAQATGRGYSAAEATQNLVDTMQQTIAALAPKAEEAKPTTTLGNLLECGMKRAVEKGDYGLVERLAKAAALVLSGAVQPGNREGVWTVRSAARPEVWYELEPARNQCSCPDQEKRIRTEQPGWCKHLLSYAFYDRLNS